MKTRWIIPVGATGRVEIKVNAEGKSITLRLYDTAKSQSDGATLTLDETSDVVDALRMARVEAEEIQRTVIAMEKPEEIEVREVGDE